MNKETVLNIMNNVKNDYAIYIQVNNEIWKFLKRNINYDICNNEILHIIETEYRKDMDDEFEKYNRNFFIKISSINTITDNKPYKKYGGGVMY